MRYTLKATDTSLDGRTQNNIIFEFDEIFLPCLLEKLEDFIVATGFRLKGHLEVVPEGEDEGYNHSSGD